MAGPIRRGAPSPNATFAQYVMLSLHGGAPITAERREMTGNMFANAAQKGLFDRLAIGLSGLCLIHCLASAIFVALLATAGGFLPNPIIHEVGLTFAIGIGVAALGRGIVEHGFMMPSSIGGLGLRVMAGSVR